MFHEDIQRMGSALHCSALIHCEKEQKGFAEVFAVDSQLCNVLDFPASVV